MKRTVSIGNQSFADIITNNYFYIDKTMFIREWWESGDTVTLITRPRRFGKTLNMSMMECFFSTRYAGRADLFEGLSIWKEEKYRQLQGTCPVISLSFADIKDGNYQTARERICRLIAGEYARHTWLLEGEWLTGQEKESFRRKSIHMSDVDATLAIRELTEYLCRYSGKKVIILLDEYDTPMQEAYVNGYWKEMAGFIRSLFNSTFKTNPYLSRAIMTGITRVSRESIFSDLNNLEIITTTSEKYETSFGFTQEEVWEALEECGLSGQKEQVKTWYDGFTFGKQTGIYNPWSILNYLDKRKFAAYWANTSSNSLAGQLIREGSKNVKLIMEDLLYGKSFHARIDEQIVYDELDGNEEAIWSLLLAAGYLKVVQYEEKMTPFGDWVQDYELALTNFEVRVMFQGMIRRWFGASRSDYNSFLQALLRGNTEEMNAYMNRVCETVFSFFDTAKSRGERTEPEKFYHGFVLGLMMEFNERYVITSNRESGLGRYDVTLEPRNRTDDAVLIEFKVRNPKKERTLEDTLQNALRQIEERGYDAGLKQRGIEEERIRRYGFAFEGKNVLIGGA
jgi:hypothetical protein